MHRQRTAGGFVTYQVWALTMLDSWLRHHPAQMASGETTAPVSVSTEYPRVARLTRR